MTTESTDSQGIIWVPITTDGTAARIRAVDFQRITERHPIIPRFRLGQSHGSPVIRAKLDPALINPEALRCNSLCVADLVLETPFGFHAECQSDDFRDLRPENWRLVPNVSRGTPKGYAAYVASIQQGAAA